MIGRALKLCCEHNSPGSLCSNWKFPSGYMRENFLAHKFVFMSRAIFPTFSCRLLTQNVF